MGTRLEVDRLEVDTAWLRATAGRLGSVADALGGQERAAAAGPLVGSGTLAHALHEVATDWSHSRRRLLHRVEHLRQLAAEAGGRFDEVDASLVARLQERSGSR